MSGGNVREALRFVIAFLGSGHVDAEKIIEKHEPEKNQMSGIGDVSRARFSSKATNGYVIPVHEFLRAVIYGDYAQYDPASSPVCNVLDISTSDAREHFLLPNILSFIERSSGAAEGFVNARSIFGFAQQLGFQPEQIHFALDRAVDKRLLEKSARYTPEIADFRMTTVGAYTLSKLLKWFVYLDAVVVDTPIVDEAVRPTILNVDYVDKRVERARLFRSYLDDQSGKLASANTAFDWPSVSRDLVQNIDVADRAIQAAMARAKGTRPFGKR